MSSSGNDTTVCIYIYIWLLPIKSTTAHIEKLSTKAGGAVAALAWAAPPAQHGSFLDSEPWSPRGPSSKITGILGASTILIWCRHSTPRLLAGTLWGDNFILVSSQSRPVPGGSKYPNTIYLAKTIVMVPDI